MQFAVISKRTGRLWRAYPTKTRARRVCTKLNQACHARAFVVEPRRRIVRARKARR